jgi:predicted ArsR family transcriptional regulator
VQELIRAAEEAIHALDAALDKIRSEAQRVETREIIRAMMRLPDPPSARAIAKALDQTTSNIYRHLDAIRNEEAGAA